MRLFPMKPFPLRLLATLAGVFLWLAVGSFKPGSRAQEPDPRPESNRKMAAMLEEIAGRVNSGPNPFAVRTRIDFMKKLAVPTDLRERLSYHIQLGQMLLNEGDTQDAIGQFQQVLSLVQQNQLLFEPKTLRNLHSLLGTAYLRLGEQQNCITGHNIDSCLLPIRGGGIHRLQESARTALQEFRTVLQEDPEDMGARWMFNIAAMTVGEYPDGVPEAWRVPPERFKSDYEIPRFTDVAPGLGLDLVTLSGGVAIDDFDGDLDFDIFFSSWGLRDQLRYFRNNSDGTFTERTSEAGLTGLVGGLNINHADFDNDGDLDLLVLRGAWLGKLGKLPNSLLRNNGDGTFTDVTEAAGLLSFHPTPTGVWADYDNDGWLDLFIGNESVKEDVNPCQLYHNNRDGTFSDTSSILGAPVLGYVKSASWGDYNNDGLVDLYISRMLEPNLLFRNEGRQASGEWKFLEVAAQAGVTEPVNSFPTWFWDLNNDGWLDIFVCGFPRDYISISVDEVAREYFRLPSQAPKPRLYLNKGDGTFEEVSKDYRVDRAMYGMGANFGDLDNDGFLDFYVGTGGPDFRVLVPNLMFRNAAGKYFQDVTTSGGFGHLQKGHGIAFADIDNDGDQDILAEMGGAFTGDVYQNALFLNPGNRNHWITVRLEGTRSNRFAIGARIKLMLASTAGTRTIYATVGSGGSFGSSSLQQEIGVGDAERIQTLEIHWPSRLMQSFTDVSVDQVIRIREGEPRIVPVKLKPLQLQHNAASHQH